MAAKIKVTKDSALATPTAIKFRLEQLTKQTRTGGLTRRINALRARLRNEFGESVNLPEQSKNVASTPAMALSQSEIDAQEQRREAGLLVSKQDLEWGDR